MVNEHPLTEEFLHFVNQNEKVPGPSHLRIYQVSPSHSYSARSHGSFAVFANSQSLSQIGVPHEEG